MKRVAAEEEDDDEFEESDDEPIVEESNPISFVGLNMCGCDPGAECSVVVFKTAQEALAHALETHCKKIDGLWKCGWWGCDFSDKNFDRLERHFQTHHLFGHWKCEFCSACHKLQLHARGCRHVNEMYEVVAQYSFCEWKNCPFSQQRMEADVLRDHVLNHPKQEAPKGPYVCHWKACEKNFGSSSALKKHMSRSHLGIKWLCSQCQKQHASKADAIQCCGKGQVGQHVVLRK